MGGSFDISVFRNAFRRGGFTPLVFNPLIWLDATDLSTITKDGNGFVSKWADKSGNGNDAAQATGSLQPKLVGNAVVFDGVDDYLNNLTKTPSAKGSVFIVEKTGALGFNSWAYGDTKNGIMSGVAISSDAGNKLAFFVESSAYRYDSTSNYSQNTSYITALNFDTSDDVVELYVNGTLDSTISTVNITSSAGYILGKWQGGVGVPFDGSISSVLRFPNKLTSAEVTQVTNYLNAKYGIF